LHLLEQCGGAYFLLNHFNESLPTLKLHSVVPVFEGDDQHLEQVFIRTRLFRIPVQIVYDLKADSSRAGDLTASF